MYTKTSLGQNCTVQASLRKDREENNKEDIFFTNIFGKKKSLYV